jgi:hypothetical protein
MPFVCGLLILVRDVIDVLDREIQLVFTPFTFLAGAATWPLAARAQPAA